MNHLLLAGLAALLGGCGSSASITAKAASSGFAPPVRATNGGNASLTIIACPLREAGGRAIQELLTTIVTYPAEVVIADGGGSARMVINACPTSETLDLGDAIRSTRPGARR